MEITLEKSSLPWVKYGGLYWIVVLGECICYSSWGVQDQKKHKGYALEERGLVQD